MKWLKKQWEGFLAKSFWGKFWDVLFVAVIILLIIPQGRIEVQRLIVKTGILGGTDANLSTEADPATLEWTLVDLNGQQTTLGELNDRPVFINFWATWCPPCKAEMPSIISLIEQVGDDAHFVLVTSEDPERVKSFLQKQGWDLPVYFSTTPAPPQLTAQSLPTTYVIDGKGQIIHRSEGMRDWGSEEAVELLLGE